VAVVVVALASLALSGVASGADDEPSIISVSFVAGESQGDECASAEDALSFKKVTTPESYSFVVTVSTDLCTPIDAKAAAYAMPNNRSWPWPQTLVETKEVPLGPAGVTTVTFAKGCDPIQFDLVTGATPETIDPFGEHHGPLLFPHTDQYSTSGSAYQFWPPRDGCEPTTSTSTPESTSSTASTSEVPVTVQPATTVRADTDVSGTGTNSAQQPAATVGGVQATQSSAALTVAG
jgi:hypothetical protein